MEIDGRSIGSNNNNVVARQRIDWLIQQGPGQVFQRVTIESLPDNVLLEIFDFYQVAINQDEDGSRWDWEKLVHVCRRWRYVIFESPNRLNLQLFCTENSPVVNLLDVWPPFPLAIQFDIDYMWEELDDPEENFDNLIAALDRHDRVRQIDITSPVDFLWEEIVTAMQKPFPTLRSLSFDSIKEAYPLPDTFLIGSAPCLQYLTFCAMSFPSLPQLVLSTSDLRSLHLENIPSSGYIPPETMAECLSALPKLKTLFITFEFPTPGPGYRPVPPSTRFVLPALTFLEFQGVTEYLEVLSARIDAPVLKRFKINMFQGPELGFVYDIPQTVRFFGHLKWFRSSSLALSFNPICGGTSILFSKNRISWRIECEGLECQVICLAQISSQILSFRSSVQSLIIQAEEAQWLHPDTQMDHTPWLQLFNSFPSVRTLTIPVELEPFIAAALQGLTVESAAQIFPSLHSLSINGDTSDGPSRQAAQQRMQSFITARQHSGHPVAVIRYNQRHY